MPPPPGPYAPVTWVAPYSVGDMLGGVPMQINISTGFITGIPNMLGNYVVGICVEEYRNGGLISTTRRDFQYNVADCGEPLAAFFAPKALCDTKTLQFFNESFQADYFRWYFDYPNPQATSVGFSPIYTYPDTGFYTVALIANPTEPCTDTFFQTVHVTKRYLDAAFELDYPNCIGGLTVAVSDLSIDSLTGVSGWKWVMTGPGGYLSQSTAQNPSFTLAYGGQYELLLFATAGNGCVDTLRRVFDAPFPEINALSTQLEICLGDSIALNPNGDPSLLYDWQPGLTLSDPNAANPIATPTQTSIYTVVATSPTSPCTTQTTVTVSVLDPGSLLLSAEPPSVTIGQSTQLLAEFSGSSMVVWQNDPSLSATNIPNPIATPSESTTYYASVTLSSGCVARAAISIPVLVPVCGEPNLFFPTAFSPNGDQENDILRLEGFFVESVYWVIFDRWGEKIFEAHDLADAWDGTYKGHPMPVETYGYYLRATCPGGKMMEKKGNVSLLK